MNLGPILLNRVEAHCGIFLKLALYTLMNYTSYLMVAFLSVLHGTF